jgi:hypothetical protein
MAPTTPSAPGSGSSSTSAKKPTSTAAKTPRAKAAPRRTAASRRPSNRVAGETTTAKRNATVAGNARAKAAKATKAEVKSGVKLAETYVERAVLVPVGAALAAREMIAQTVGDLLDTYGSTKKTEAQLKRFEKRGVTARNQLEKEATKARKRVEHALHKRRTDVEKAVSKFDRRRQHVEKLVTDQVGGVSSKVDDTVRQAADAGQGIVSKARDTVGSII